MLIDQLTTKEIVALYNQLTKNPVRKFNDRENGMQRLLALESGKSREHMLTAAMAAKVRKPFIQQWGPLKGPDVALDAPADMIVTAAAKRAAAKKERKAGKPAPEPPATNVKVAEVPAIVLRAIRDMIPEGATGEALQVNSTDLARKLQTSITAICKASDTLEKLTLVVIEDDSPNDETKFYYISLTPLGRSLELTPAKPIKAERPAKATKGETPTKAPKEKRLPNSTSGPNSSNTGKFLYLKVEGNPRREGTHGHKSFSLIKNGMTYEAYRAAGGRANDLAWDVDHGYIELREK